MQNNSGLIVLLGTGGTIAGTARDASDNVGYTAGQVAVADLVGALPALRGRALEAEQVAQLNSKDMDHATWQRLAQRVAHHLARPEVAGLVIPHGTDTLEETAWFLHRVLAPAKPVVLTAAMRPASSLQADGPQNLLDAVTVAGVAGARGVLTVLAGRIHGPMEVRKLHPYRVDAFGSGDAGPLAGVDEGRVQRWRDWPVGEPLGLACVDRPVAQWPRVDVLACHAGADGALVAAVRALGARGIVVEGTGNGSVHVEMERALMAAQADGIQVLRATRCQGGSVVGDPPGALPSVGALTPGKARVELLLRLLAASH